jgi:bleomycin hydrolase
MTIKDVKFVFSKSLNTNTMKFITGFALCLLLIVNQFVKAQSQEGKVTEDMIKEVRSQFSKEPKTVALINAISNNKIKDLDVSREKAGSVDHLFTYRVKTRGITNQKSSGRCWLFTGLNVFRPIVIDKLSLDEFEFSQNYNFFWDQFEKSNLFLEGIIATVDKPLSDRNVEWLLKNPIGDGGQWTTFADIVTKYGVVPSTVMPETVHSESTGELSALLSSKLRTFAMEIRTNFRKGGFNPYAELRKDKVAMLSEVYRILSFCLGEPPTTFSWRYQDKAGKLVTSATFTPQSFYRQMVGINLSDYVMCMNDPSREFNKLYEIQYDRNMVDGYNWRYINLPASDLKEMAKQSIMKNEALYFSCDVGQQLNKTTGILNTEQYRPDQLFGIKLTMDKKQRIQSFESSSSHGMALIGLDTDSIGKPVKWLLENSWGPDAGHKGYLTMTDSWFEEYMFRLDVNKKYVPATILKVLNQKPIMLPPWDAMFTPEL